MTGVQTHSRETGGCAMNARITDKKSRVLCDSRRTRVLYSQPVHQTSSCGELAPPKPEKKADKTGHARTPPDGGPGLDPAAGYTVLNLSRPGARRVATSEGWSKIRL